MPVSAALFMDYGVAAGLDAATTAWAVQVVTNGGTVSTGRKTTVNNLIVGLKADGIWTKLDRLYILAAENTQSALTDLKGLVLATANGPPTFVVDRGYTGTDGSGTVWIDTGFNPALAGGNYTQNSAHLSAWSNSNIATVSGGVITGLDGSTGLPASNVYPQYADGNAYFRINDAANSAGTANANSTGHYIANRTGASLSGGYKNGSLFATLNQASGALVNFAGVAICADHNSSPSYGQGSGHQITMQSIGGGLSATDASNFYNRLRTYMTAVGVP
jgi:hypothetical protein